MPVSNELSIHAYLHCEKCLAELPEGMSPKEWSKLAVGMTREGFQVWCNRHECNVMHVYFEGQKHPANTTRKGE